MLMFMRILQQAFTSIGPRSSTTVGFGCAGLFLLALGCAPETSGPDLEDTVSEGDEESEVEPALSDTEPAILLRQSVFDSVTGAIANTRHAPFSRIHNAIDYDKASDFRSRTDLGQLPSHPDSLPLVTAYTAYNLPNAAQTPVERIWISTPSGGREQYLRTIDPAGNGDWYLANANDPASAASAFPQPGGNTGMFTWNGDTATGILLDRNDTKVGDLGSVSIADVDSLTKALQDVGTLTRHLGALRSQSDVSVSTAPREQDLMCSKNVGGECEYDLHGEVYRCSLTTDGSMSQSWWREEHDSSTEDTIVGFYRTVPLLGGAPEFSCASSVSVLPQSMLEPLGLANVTGQGSYVAAYNPDVPTPTRYVALGDSYSAGAGLTPYVVHRTPDTSDDRCQRSQSGWPEMIASAIGARVGTDTFGDQFSNSTCGGATTADVMQGAQFPGMAPQIVHINEAVDLVTFSIGGNDLGFGPLIQGCVLGGNYPGSNDDCRTYMVDAPEGVTRRTFEQEVEARLSILGGNTDLQDQVLVDPKDPSRVISPIKSILEAIIDRAGPSTKIRLVGAPKIMSGEAIPASQSCLVGLTGDEAVWLDDATERFNTIMSNAVVEAREYALAQSPNGGIVDISFVDPSDAFEGHGACMPNPEDRWINLVDVDTAGADWAPWRWDTAGTMHPNAEGAFQLAKLVLESL